MKRSIFVSIGILIVVGIGMFSCLRLFKGESQEETMEEIVEVKRGDIKASIVEKGILEPALKVDVTSRIKGVVNRVFVREGDTVEQFTPLLEFDRTELLNELKKAERNLTKARISLDEAEAELVRNNELFKKGFLAKNEVKKSEIKYQLAKIDLEEKEEEYRTTQKKLEQALVLSPIRGVIIQRNIDEGEVWQADTPLDSQNKPYLRIADLSKWILRTKIPEVDIGKLFIGGKVNIKVDAYPEKCYQGKIVNISPSAHEFEQIKTFEVIIRLEGEHLELRPFMTAKVEIVTDLVKNVLYLPIESVFRRGDKRVVLIREELGWKEVEVEVGISNGERIEIKKGLKEGDKVALIDYVKKEELLPKEGEWW